MAKKRTVAPPEAGVTPPGSVSFSIGLTIPATPQYSMVRMDLTGSLPIQPGESFRDAVVRVSTEVHDALMERRKAIYESCDQEIIEVVRKGKTPGR